MTTAPSGQPGRQSHVDPIVVQIVEGTLASAEAEVEAAIERTARSPMIREARDFRGGIHDRHCRKLTGRSYSALVQPIVRDFPIETIQPGDVFFHNDVYGSEGGIGHLPDMCCHRPRPPRRRGRRVRPGVRPPRRHRRRRPGLDAQPRHLVLPGRADRPARAALRPRASPNDDLIRLMARNSRMPDSLRGDLDAEVAACRMGAERIADLFRRYGRADRRSLLRGDPRAHHRRPSARAAEQDPRRHLRLGRLRRARRRRSAATAHPADDPDQVCAEPKLLIDFAGTSPQAKGPINHAGNYADGVFLKKWIAPILRNLADTPERMAELDVNEGVVPLIELRFPPPGTLLTPIFPAPANARTFVILRLLGILAGVLAKATDGIMPADQETIRYTGLPRPRRRRPAVPDARGARRRLGRPALGRRLGHRSTSSQTPRTCPSSSPRRASRCWSRRSPWRPIPAAPASVAAASATARRSAPPRDAYFLSVADRSILGCWGLKGGKAGKPFRVTVDPGGPNERDLEGLVDDEPIPAGTLVRIDTTGGGGWGDPLEREPELVALDVTQGKVSPTSARDDYGVVLRAPTGALESTRPRRRRCASSCCAAERGFVPFFDRGPGYRQLSGRDYAEVDVRLAARDRRLVHHVQRCLRHGQRHDVELADAADDHRRDERR